jgi:hypothetical protein
MGGCGVSKWREFWLDHNCYYTQNEITQSVSTEYPINPVSLVHVIEYVGYAIQQKRIEQLEAELESLKKKLEKLEAAE